MPIATHPADLFPARLRRARELRGLNQSELAARAGLQPSAVSHFESASRKPSFDNLKRLADALEVTTDYLLGRIEDPTGLAVADELYRDWERMSSADRKYARRLIADMARRAEPDKGGGGDE